MFSFEDEASDERDCISTFIHSPGYNAAWQCVGQRPCGYLLKLRFPEVLPYLVFLGAMSQYPSQQIFVSEVDGHRPQSDVVAWV